MRAARPLERLELLLHFERTRNDDDGDERQQVLECRQKIEAAFARLQDVIEDERVRRVLRNLLEGVAAFLDTNQSVSRQGFLVDFVLEIVVLNDQDGGMVRVHAESPLCLNLNLNLNLLNLG